MAQVKTKRKVVKALAKGQVTIPREFRKALKINDETLLTITIVGDHLEISPFLVEKEDLRRYTEADISRFLDDDKLDAETAGKVRELLKRGEL